MCSRDNVWVKNSSTLQIPLFFFKNDALIIVINSVIGEFTERTKYDWLPRLSDYNSTEWLTKNKAANAPITFEEIVMVMIKRGVPWFRRMPQY